MNLTLSITKKELRGYFTSPIALIFLATFVLVTLFTFLWVETFFARNIADVRPLFLWLPRLLIFLCAALTMRQWSEEQKLGTLEVLLTLPVETRKLVIGKFLAALALVAIALALTFHIPIAVSTMGDLDWGPVVGGYAAALLLASAYLAIGLFISALTDNQIVALILTCVTCGVLYVIGTEPVTSAAGTRGAEVLSALGTGSRFESIRRGLIDIRDVLYYASITVTFLVLNTLILKAKGWSQGASTRNRRMNAVALGALVALNLIAANLWMAHISALRLDMTQRKEYSISKVTRDLVRSLPEPLLIRGYFSEKTHPLLAPMVPRIRDMIEEYGVVSGGKVRTEFIDPRNDEELEKEANQSYGIKSFPFRVQDRHDVGVVNSYFSILVKYGDQFQVINFEDLIEVQISGQNNIEVKLRNLEYDLTRAIKKVAFGFQTLDAMFADMKGDAELKVFVTPRTLPENFKNVPATIEKVAKDIQKQSGGKFKFEVVDVDSGGDAMRQDLYQKYGFKPFATSLFSQDTFYLHLLLRVGDKLERLFPGESMAEADIKKEITAGLQRGAPGFLKTLGIAKSLDVPMPNPHMPQQPQQPVDTTRMLTKQLSETYQVRDVDLKSGHVPDDIDVLMVVAPKNLDDKQRFAIDQYLMRGGSVVVLAGKYDLDPNSMEGLSIRKVNTGLEDMLASYGVTVQDSMVLDPQNERFPYPVTRDLGGIRVQDIQMLNFPFFVDVRPDGMDKESLAVSGLPAVTMQWVSPLVVSTPDPKTGEAGAARQVSVLLRSSDKSWTQSDTNIQPNRAKNGEEGYAPSGEQKSYPLAVAIKGSFESHFKDKPSPIWGADEKNAGADKNPDRTGRTLKKSPEDARLVVVGSSDFANDFVLSISRQSGSDRFTNNLHFLQNLADWSVEDTDLLKIRSRGTFARTLRHLDPKAEGTYEVAMYLIPMLALGFIVLVLAGKRRRMQPLELDSSSSTRRIEPDVGQLPSSGAEARS